jgi:hypothetical protein
VNAYRAVLAAPGARSFVTAAFVGRLSLPMLTLGTVVLVHSRTGSYALAGAVTAAAAVAFAAAAPVAGRLADRARQARVLVVSLAVHLAGLAGLVAAAVAGGPQWALFAAAVPAGAAFPQLPAMVRTRWAGLLARRPRPADGLCAGVGPGRSGLHRRPGAGDHLGRAAVPRGGAGRRSGAGHSRHAVVRGPAPDPAGPPTVPAGPAGRGRSPPPACGCWPGCSR